jgi:hypothetical protein
MNARNLATAIFLRPMTIIALASLGLVVTAPAASAATVLTSCGTISSPGNYVLGRNITASGTCFTIGSSNVGFDLQGHTLKGNGTGTGVVAAESSDLRYPYSNIVITSGIITKFATGIDLSNSANASLTSINVNNNGGDGIVLAAPSLLTKSKASHNGGHGIAITNGGDAVVVDCTADDNGGDGMYFNGGDNRVVNIKADGNAGDGIALPDGGNYLTTSEASGNGGAGIYLICPGNALGDAAHGNGMGNLVELGSVPCTNVNNNAL